MATEWRGLYRIGGIAAFALIVYGVATLVQVMVLGGRPATAAEAFGLLQANKIIGLLRLDLLTVLVLPLYYVLFLALYAALQPVDRSNVTLATVLVFGGLTLVLATPTGLSLVPLSERYAAATTEAARAELRAAGEALLAIDIWHHTGAFVGGILAQCGAVLISVVMLRGGVFSRVTGWLGIGVHGLDLVHILITPVLPLAAAVLMAVAGTFYPVWFFLVGRRLLRLAAPGGQ